MRTLFAVALLATLSATGHAQSASIAPGMSRAQVVAAFGEPVNARTASEYTYLFYRNDCGKACGINDLVILRRDSVVDAVLRSSSRRYTGKSSSPTALGPGRVAVVPESERIGEPINRPVPKADPVAVPAAAHAVAPAAATPAPATAAPAAPAPRQPSPETMAKLRRDLLGSGLTSTQIRARLRAEGYDARLLDADMTHAAQTSPSTMKPGTPKDTKPSITTPTPNTTTRPPTP